MAAYGHTDHTAAFMRDRAAIHKSIAASEPNNPNGVGYAPDGNPGDYAPDNNETDDAAFFVHRIPRDQRDKLI